MPRQILLFEPYPDIATLLTNALDDMEYGVVLGTPSERGADEIRSGLYRTVFINLDQNRPEWLDVGSELAELATQCGMAVVMIPDGRTAKDTVTARGWLYISKPFRISTLKAVMAEADQKAAAFRKPEECDIPL